MDFTSTSTIIFTIVLGVYLVASWKIHQKRRHLPPGPAPLPFLGTLRNIKPNLLYKSYLQLSKEYGPVFTVWMGSFPVVVLCGYEVVRDALVNHAEEFSGRATITSGTKITGGHGIINSNGEQWQTLRRFAISTLRNFGMGKRSMEERVQKEAGHLVKAIANMKGEAFNPKILVQSAASNVVCSVVFGERFDYKDQMFLQILKMIELYLLFIRSYLGQLYNAIPAIMEFLPGPQHNIFEEGKALVTFIKEKIDLHRRTMDADSPRDFIDCFLIKANKNEPEFTNANLVTSTFDLFLAGTETTSGTIQYSLLVMVKYPHIQAKIQQEIDEVVGPSFIPSIEHRVKMPYTNAVIYEIQRFVDQVPMSLPHTVTRDVEFRGYKIPKGTKVIPILTSVLHDPKQWETPNDFNPGHFLDENGKFRNRPAFMPFSAGKRLCPGEGLAQMEIFLFLTTLLQNFSFKSVTDPSSLNLTTMRRSFRSTGLSFQLSAIRRQNSTA